MALTDTKARKAETGERDYKLADERGLFLLVRATGSKLWRMKYRFGGKEKLLSFGPYPEVSLAKARDRRDEARSLLRNGIDPSAEKKRHAASSSLHTFESVAREWHELQKRRWAPVHADEILRGFERDVFPALGAKPIDAIDTPMVLAHLRTIEARGAIEAAHRLRQRIDAVYVYALSKGIVIANPAAVVTKALAPIPRKKRRPALVDLADLRTLLRTAEASGAIPITLLASRLLALTAARPGVVRRALWADFLHIDWTTDDPAPDALWHIPAAQMKLVLERKDDEAFDHLVPLAPEAVAVLRAVRRLSGRGSYVFPSSRHAHIPLSENAIGYLYNRVGWHGRHVPHGWRAAFSTVMNERAMVAGNAGDRAVIDLMLAHVPANKIESVYNRAQFMERRREIAEEWAGLISEGLVQPDSLLELARRVSR